MIANADAAEQLDEATFQSEMLSDSTGARLIVAQGPSQVLAALTVIGREESDSSVSQRHIYLLGNFCAGEYEQSILDSCLRMLSAQSACETITSGGLENDLYSGKLNFVEYCEKILRLLRGARITEVYVCRTMMPINEAALGLFPDAKKICYGDGYGVFDSGEQEWVKPYNPDGFCKVDQCNALFPSEENHGGSMGVKVHQIDRRHGVGVVTKAAKAYAREIESLSEQLTKDGTNLGLITTGTMCASGALPTPEHEVEFYVASLLADLDPSVRYVVKAHPRDFYDQGGRLTSELRTRGYDIVNLPEYDSIPTELIMTIVGFSEIHPVRSSVGYASRLFDGSPSVKYSGKAAATLKNLNPEAKEVSLQVGDRLQALTLFATYGHQGLISYEKLMLYSRLFRDCGFTFPSVRSPDFGSKCKRFKLLNQNPLIARLISMLSPNLRFKILSKIV